MSEIETVMARLDAMRRKDLDAALALFADEVTWEGVSPEALCPNRDAGRS